MSEEEAQAGAVGGAEGDDDEVTPGYKAPAQKDLKTIQDLDADDESLVKYKQQLLGGASNVLDEGGNNVIVQKMFICVINDDNTETSIELDLKDTSKLSKLKDQPVELKEGCKYKIKIQFRVQREIVSGLRYFQVTKRKGIKVDKSALMVGSYGPKTEPQTYETKPEEAPSGLISRGNYTVDSKFTDDDKNIYLAWEWGIKIVKK